MRKFLVALIVPARLHEPVRIEEIGLCLASRQALVEGNVEAISGRGWHAFLNDQAKSIPLPLNPRAEVLIREAGTPIEAPVSGNAVFLGHGSDGDETDVPAQLLSLAERLFATRLAA
ncbi:DUF3846 domain-containing protein [Paenarthrobacter sp. GOM3]|uniref:DUF3846 domain-containing protein n=1 Tax=Paenarthrobacter sp. GOM3 TaxID=2782567 RepID=UPI001BA8B0DC